MAFFAIMVRMRYPRILLKQGGHNNLTLSVKRARPVSPIRVCTPLRPAFYTFPIPLTSLSTTLYVVISVTPGCVPYSCPDVEVWGEGTWLRHTWVGWRISGCCLRSPHISMFFFFDCQVTDGNVLYVIVRTIWSSVQRIRWGIIHLTWTCPGLPEMHTQHIRHQVILLTLNHIVSIRVSCHAIAVVDIFFCSCYPGYQGNNYLSTSH